MSLHSQQPHSIPAETSRVAHAAFPNGTLCLRIADALGAIYQDSQFAGLFSSRGQSAEAPGLLGLATVLQFVEGLSDRQAADAVRGRIDWKYALGLELTDPGFDHTVLSEFRTRLVEGNAERLLLDTLLQRLREQGLVKAKGRQRTDSTHVLTAVRELNRLERVGETVRAALNELAGIAPEWLQALAPPDWYERYGRRVENYRLPKADTERLELAAAIGADGRHLLAAVDAATEQPWLAQMPAVHVLREVWAAQYIEEDGRLRWRTLAEMPPSAEQICSPYDPEARYSTKRDISWVGYKAHLTETCDLDTPNLITNVETTPATTPDDNMLPVVHRSLAKKDLLPSEHLVDPGYTGSHVLVDSQQQHGVVVIGPVNEDSSWQARAGEGFDKAQFRIDWDRQVATCPQGKESVSWLPSPSATSRMDIEVRFSGKDCTPCPMRSHCTRAKTAPRIIALQERENHEALQSARQRQTTEEFCKTYAARAGIEGTHAQAIRRCRLRRCRYIGSAKTHLQHVITAVAVNLIRLAEWFSDTPTAKTRRSRFATLQPAA